MYKKYYKYRNHSLTHSLTLTGWISSEMLKTLERDHHQVRSSNLVTFRHLLPLVRFHTTEWRHKNNRSTPLFYGCSQKELNSKNFEKIIHFPILKETQPTIFWAIHVFTSLSVAFSGLYFTWPSTDICLKDGNIRKWHDSICLYFLYTDQMQRVKKNVIWKNISYFVWRFLQCKLNKN